MISNLAPAALRALPPETAHRLTLAALAKGYGPQSHRKADAALQQTLWDIPFAAPMGLAAGFDKNAEAPDAVLRLGAAFVEIGAVTPKPQPGNPKPRVFRLMEDRAVINRLGFNNEGLAVAQERLKARKDAGVTGVVGANLGANKDAADRAADYETVLRGLWGLCDFYTVNVSSPNTEKLRDLQGAEALRALLKRVLETRDELAKHSAWAPVLVKIAPDLSASEIEDIANVALETNVDGVVATNTTISRPQTLRSIYAGQSGGLSGAPLFDLSTHVLRSLRRRLGEQIPLIGVGGVDSAETAYAKIRAGASLVQLYTGMIYKGPGVYDEIANGIAERLRRDGFENIREAVGADV